MSNRDRVDASVSVFTRTAGVVDQAAYQLQNKFGDEPIPTGMLQREIERIGGYRPGSVLPSDFCYNLINRASFSGREPLLERVGRGRYRYLGPNHPYTGPIYWKPREGQERQIGSWVDGVCRLDCDPREQASSSGAT